MSNISSFFLNALKKQDQDATDVIATTSQVKLFRFDVLANKWASGDLEGTLLFYKRSGKPSLGLVLLARDSITNWFKKFDCNVEIQIRLGQEGKPAFLLYRTTDPRGESCIEGLSFPDNNRCTLMYKTIMETTAQQAAFPSYAAMVSGPKNEEAKKVNEKRINQNTDAKNQCNVYAKNVANSDYSAAKSNHTNAKSFKAYGKQEINPKGIPGQQKKPFMESPQGVASVQPEMPLVDPAIVESCSSSSNPANPHTVPLGPRSPLPLLSFPPPPNSNNSPQKFPTLAMNIPPLNQAKVVPALDINEGSKYLRSFIGLPGTVTNGNNTNHVADLSTSSVDQSSSSNDEMDDHTRFAREVTEKLNAHVEESKIQILPNNGYMGQPVATYEQGGQINKTPGQAGNQLNNLNHGSTTFYNSGVEGTVFHNHLVQIPLRPPHDFGLTVDNSNGQPLLLPQHMECLPAKVRRSESEVKPAVNPLTKDQLLQAIEYLLRTDRDFIGKIHEAYVKSLMDNLKL